LKTHNKIVAVLLTVGLCAPIGGAQSTKSVQHIQSETAPIATAVWANGLLFISGQTASPISAPDAPKQSEPAYGDTKTQSMSIFQKIDAILKAQDLSLKDVISMRVYLVGVPAQGGAMDFAGFQAAYANYFGTASQKLKPARATVQVAALAHPWSLVEIEVVAAR
jgi:enamine deaminase RidA (YjgF/YER057c/UK114 family)